RRELYFFILLVETAVAAIASVIGLAAFGVLDKWTLILLFSQCLVHWAGVNKAFYEREMPYGRLGVIETVAATSSHAFAVALALLGAGESVLYCRELFSGLCILGALGAARAVTILPLRRPTVEELKGLLREARAVWLDGMLEGS